MPKPCVVRGRKRAGTQNRIGSKFIYAIILLNHIVVHVKQISDMKRERFPYILHTLFDKYIPANSMSELSPRSDRQNRPDLGLLSGLRVVDFGVSMV